MYEIIQTIHSYWAYPALFLLAIAVINSIIGASQNKEYVEKDKKIGIFALSTIHTQLIFGLIIYFVSPNGFSSILNNGMSAVMKNSALRLTAIEHPFINILAIVLMTIGWVKHKKSSSSQSKFKILSIYFGITLLLILSRIPWNMWF